MICKYGSHRTNADGSCNVSFNRPDGIKYYVNMPKEWKGDVLGWIKSEKIEDFLSKKFEHDRLYDEVNNIKRRIKMGVCNIKFHFDNFDGNIEIYNASFGYYDTSGLLNSLINLFDFKNPKFKEEFIKVAKKNNIKVKTINIVNQRDDKDYEIVEITSSWEVFNRDNKIKELLAE